MTHLRVFTNYEPLSSLKALAVAHCAGGSRNEFSDGFITGLAAVATLKLIEVK